MSSVVLSERSRLSPSEDERMIRQAALGSLVYVSRVVLAAVVIVTLPVAAAASSAAPRGGWISPRVVNKTGSDDDPSVAVAPGGVA